MNHFLLILLSIVLWGDFNDIAKVNDLKRQAKEEYNAGQYKDAITHYRFLTDSLQIDDDNIRLNLANAYYLLKDTANALNNYNSLLSSANKSVKSVAHQQLGIMANRNKKFKEAINHFKEALKADPTNEDARYNYELLKKILKEQEQKDQNKDQNKDKDKKDDKNQDKKDQENKEDQNKQDQDKKDGQDKDQKGKDKEKQKKEEEKKQGEEKDKKEEQPKDGEQKEDQEKSKDQPPSLSENLKDMKISEEKAKMIMEALKNNEIQYIQQNKRKATKKPDPDKPDW